MRAAATYNTANQMVTADSYVYLYDGSNKRVKQDDSHGVSYSFYDSNGKLMYRNEGGMHVDYYYLGGKLVAKKKGSTVTYLHADYLGSPAAESNTAGPVTRRMHYQPFGEPIETPTDDIGYTGHKFDTDLGLSYMQARYYDPVLGRLMANDPVGFSPASPMTFNRYSYANNNPYKYTDPTGKIVKAIISFTKVAYKSIRHGKNPIKGVIDEVAGAVDDATTLLDGQLTVDDALAVVDLVVGTEFNNKVPKGSPDINPRDVANRTPAEIDEFAKGKGLEPKGPDPMQGSGAYTDPVTGNPESSLSPEYRVPTRARE